MRETTGTIYTTYITYTTYTTYTTYMCAELAKSYVWDTYSYRARGVGR